MLSGIKVCWFCLQIRHRASKLPNVMRWSGWGILARVHYGLMWMRLWRMEKAALFACRRADFGIKKCTLLIRFLAALGTFSCLRNIRYSEIPSFNAKIEYKPLQAPDQIIIFKAGIKEFYTLFIIFKSIRENNGKSLPFSAHFGSSRSRWVSVATLFPLYFPTK